MRFRQLDHITLLEPGAKIEAVQKLTGDEDYLRDHFPRFPVMPGVLMLEALYQASALLVRATEEYRSGLVLLRAAKNVKFADFVQPGQSLYITAEIVKQVDRLYVLKAIGRKGDSTAVSGRLEIECMSHANGAPEIVDQLAARYMQQLTTQLQSAAIVSS